MIRIVVDGKGEVIIPDSTTVVFDQTPWWMFAPERVLIGTRMATP